MIFSLKRILLKSKQADLAMASQGLKLGSYLKEFRIFLCQKSSSSSGIRDFIQKHYISMKKTNPSFPILIRECSGIEPKIFARYEFGKETSVPLSNLKSDQVLDVVKKLASEKK